MGSVTSGTLGVRRTTKFVVKTRFILPALALLSFGAAACGSDDAITVNDPWARSSPAMVTMGAAYMQIAAPAGDTLIGVTVPASIADHAEIHEMVPAAEADSSMDMGDDSSMEIGDHSSMDMGAMVMQQIMSLDLPAGETVELKPGGYHVMLIDLASPLEIGSTFDLTLDFETADDMVVSVEVREG